MEKKELDTVKSYDDFDVYNFQNKEVLLDKLIYLGFTNLEWPKRFLYETWYNSIQQIFEPNLE